MARTSVKIRGLSSGIKKIESTVHRVVSKEMTNAMKDLERTASETAPVDEGDLEMGGYNGVDRMGGKYTGFVGFEAFADAPTRSYEFNYAIWIHEMNYNLGAKSRKKSGGSGMSGKRYPVGKHYLTRPLEGEAPAYREKFEEEIKKALR